MGMSAAERMRKYRARLKNDPQKYENYLTKEKSRYQKKKQTRQDHHITEDERTLRKKRRQWKIQKRKERARQKKIQSTLDKVLSPPTSPIPSPNHESSSASRQRIAGLKTARKNYRKMRRELTKAAEELKSSRQKVDKYRKRYQRLEQKLLPVKNKTTKETQKERLFNSLIVKNLRLKMKTFKSEKQKQLVAKLVSSDILKKYKVMHLAKLSGVSQKRIRSSISGQIKYQRKKKRNAISEDVRQSVHTSLELDINSRVMPGKKDTITRNGVKKQRRILNDTLKGLHKKYVSVPGNRRVSYVTFCRLKPFWILDPTCSKRDTCTCKLHSNIKFKIDRLVEHKVLLSKSVSELCREICCEDVKKECMYRECVKCREKTLRHIEEFDEGRQVWVYCWQNRVEERENVKANGQINRFKVQVTVKEKVQYTLRNLLDETNATLASRICRHEFNISHQFNEIKNLKDNLNENECIVHIDFSENYACKMGEEVQGMHFGASRNQVSLHTGVIYTKNNKPSSFCTLSPNTRHDPLAIWAHLHPILDGVRNADDSINVVHFVSDGPTTQYRSRKNFYLFNHLIHKYGFQHATWNFTEAGHGKGAPDGIGGLIKRTADKAVSFGRDICDANDMFRELQNSNIAVQIYLINDVDIENLSSELPQTLKSVPDTMKLHQVLSTIGSTVISVRPLSCFCTRPTICSCFNRKDVDLQSVVPSRLSLSNSMSNLPVSDSASTLQTSQSTTRPNSCLPVSNPGSRLPVVTNSDGTLPQTKTVSKLNPVHEGTVDPDMIGQWCVVEYDGVPFSGVILDVDQEEIEVKVLHKVGANRYFWPLIDDVLWYKYSQVVTLIPEPTHVTKRHLQIRPDIWAEISEKYD